jgi:integrase-like protein
LYFAVEDIDHSRTKTKSPQTNGICERFHKSALNEFYRVAFRKKVYRSIDELQADLEEYNEARPHQGRWCFGKTPMQTFLDTMPMTKEKMIAAYGNGHQNLIGQPGSSCPIEFRLTSLAGLA